MFIENKSAYKWTHAGHTCIFQGATVFTSSLSRESWACITRGWEAEAAGQLQAMGGGHRGWHLWSTHSPQFRSLRLDSSLTAHDLECRPGRGCPAEDGLSFLLRHSRSQGDENMMLPWLSSALGPTP